MVSKTIHAFVSPVKMSQEVSLLQPRDQGQIEGGAGSVHPPPPLDDLRLSYKIKNIKKNVYMWFIGVSYAIP